ncbi:MAG: hypothetical protein HY617_00825 [Candidatus Sungbacteria bacterium]|nr:hypothetical protein [Candidatus Sungbacteria bacterium]
MKKLSLIISLCIFGCTPELSQQFENAARLAWVDYGRVESAPPSGQCSLSPINWRGERVALLLVLRRDMLGDFSEEMQHHIMRQFNTRLVQRGAVMADLSSATYQMRVSPFIRGELAIFQITVLDSFKRPVAYNLTKHHLATSWSGLTERVQGELIGTMALNAFVRLCVGSPSWQW